MSLTTNRIKPAFPPTRLVAGQEVLHRDLLDDVEPPVELRIVRQAHPELERDPARRHVFLVQFVREGEPTETQGFDTEGEAYGFTESVLEWNQDEPMSDPRAWPAWTDEARYEPTEPAGPDPSDASWWAQNSPTARDGFDVVPAA